MNGRRIGRPLSLLSDRFDIRTPELPGELAHFVQPVSHAFPDLSTPFRPEPSAFFSGNRSPIAAPGAGPATLLNVPIPRAGLWFVRVAICNISGAAGALFAVAQVNATAAVGPVIWTLVSSNNRFAVLELPIVTQIPALEAIDIAFQDSVPPAGNYAASVWGMFCGS